MVVLMVIASRIARVRGARTARTARTTERYPFVMWRNLKPGRA